MKLNHKLTHIDVVFICDQVVTGAISTPTPANHCPIPANITTCLSTLPTTTLTTTTTMSELWSTPERSSGGWAVTRPRITTTTTSSSHRATSAIQGCIG